jgi:hypothetical protein
MIYFYGEQIVHVELSETLVNHTYSPNDTVNNPQSHIFLFIVPNTYNNRKAEGITLHQKIIKPHV